MVLAQYRTATGVGGAATPWTAAPGIACTLLLVEPGVTDTCGITATCGTTAAFGITAAFPSSLTGVHGYRPEVGHAARGDL